MAPVVTIWSDVHCPWATTAIHRLRRARERDGLDVEFRLRAWPLELVNGEVDGRDALLLEVGVLSTYEPEIFSAYQNDAWPSTFLPAHELVAAARRVHGPRTAEDVDYALRLSFFRDSVDISLRPGLERALQLAAGFGSDLDAQAVLAEWDCGGPRADVLADFRESKDAGVQGSPHVFWPDGSDSVNPGFSGLQMQRGIPRIGAADPREPARLLREHLGAG
jgi:predicted DsbA family dithiol-disulfide isomerase